MSTKILWTDETWNPIVGCSKCSAGCENCYAEKMALRLANMLSPGTQQYNFGNDGVVQGMSGEKIGWSGRTEFVESALSKPLHWRAARKIFVCSMGDLFHESVPFEWIDKVFAVMALCPQHTFQVLTKRPERMKEYFEGVANLEPESDRDMELWDAWRAVYGEKLNDTDWPLPNVWLGVTAENQEMADKRIPILLQTPAALRFVSVEPMLGPVDLVSDIGGTLWVGGQRGCGGNHKHDNRPPHHHHDNRCGKGLDWVIVGAESGALMRWCAPEWPRSLVKQCQSAEVPVFVKQLHTPMINTKFKLIKEPAGWPRELPGETIINNQ